MIFRYGAILAIAALSAMPAAAAPFHHPFGEWREYNRDWLAACPDAIDEDATDYYGFSCFASTGSQELNSAGLPAYKLTILRNRLTGDLDLAFTVAADDVETDTRRPLLLAFGSEPPERLSFATDLETRYNTVNQFYVADPARKAALIEQMGERNAVVVTVPLNGGDTKEVRLSLRGVLASLDFMASHARKLAQY
ncbi:MAG: hypothetical protein KJ944_12780 [Alphaproteobacteria bacterium]|nr:hypothetical protein [Alphaproteobacteria bacterium]MBU1562704.1 hypothetical protein [Alphaproteobacteria bacterium]MBU2303460.1 hypothetical protein [Alphaproteobacteria bacterium]MBU2366985.1 hypothetical protein [Alphaproteobacteria bacterium]